MAAAAAAPDLALLVPASASEPLRLVPLPPYDDSAPHCDDAAARSHEATCAHVGDAVSGLFDTVTLCREASPTGAVVSLSACIPDDRRGQRRNEWWHAAAGGAPVRDVYGPLLVVASACDERCTTRSLSLTSWRDPAGRTHAAEEWTDAGAAMLRQLCALSAGTDERRAANAKEMHAFLQSLEAPAGGPRPFRMDDAAVAEAPACAAA